MYGVLIISFPAPEAAADADAVVVDLNPPNAWNGNILSVAPLRLNGWSPPNGAPSPPKEGTPLSA